MKVVTLLLLLVVHAACLQNPYQLGWTSLSGNTKNIASYGEEGHAIAVDQSGYVYLAGMNYFTKTIIILIK